MNNEHKTPESESLAELIGEIFNSKKNTKVRNLFNESIKYIKPAGCKVKIGWRSGKEIGFNCLFDKNGTLDIFEAVEAGKTPKK